MGDARMIAVDCRERAEDVREQIANLTDELDRLERAAELLDPGVTTPEGLSRDAEEVYAPWGYKKDGSPRMRPAPSPEHQAKAAATRRARAEAEAAAAADPDGGFDDGPGGQQTQFEPKEEVRLNVLSSTHPTQRELQDREVVHSTQEPA